VVAEVRGGVVTRTLEDTSWVKFLNSSTRKVYCIELLSLSSSSEEGAGVPLSSLRSSLSSSRSDLGPSTNVSSSTSTGTLTDTGTITECEPQLGEDDCVVVPGAGPGWRSCNICLEDMVDSDLITHIQCTAVLCRECLERAQAQQPGKCPVCMTQAEESEWVQLDLSSSLRPPLRMLKVLVTTDTGDACSRCPASERCVGCPLSSVARTEAGEVVLKPGDTLCLLLPSLEKNLIEELGRVEEHRSMREQRLKPTLDLTDCLDAFSSREVLDAANPWFCPVCRRNQVATKTLSVWRYPDFLVVYLKRFVYLERGPGGHPGSLKLEKRVSFPVTGLDLTPYLSGPLQQGGEEFSLYGCVNHYGSVTGGHYTAHTLHPVTHQWRHFNDSQVEEGVVPQGERQDDAYVLFYRRSGLQHSLEVPSPSQGLDLAMPGQCGSQEEEKTCSESSQQI